MNLESKFIFAASLVFTLLTMHVMLLRYPEPHTVVDSEGYIEYAEAILSGTFFTLRGPENISQALTLRTPGYPLLIAFSKLFSPSLDTILSVHRVVSFLVILSAFCILKSVLSAPIIGLAVISSLSHGIIFYPIIMTEWFVLNMLLLFGVLLISYYDKSQLKTLLYLCFVAALISLIRPALCMVAGIPFIMVIFSNKRSNILFLLASMLAFFLVLIWMIFNWYRLYDFSITPFLGYNMFGVTSMLGEAEIRAEDSELLKNFILSVNANKKFPPVGERLPLHEFYTGLIPIDRYFHENLINAPPPMEDYVLINKLLLTYSGRVILQEPVSYAYYVYKGFCRILENSFLLLIAMGVVLTGVIRVRSQRKFSNVAFIFFMLHLAHVGLCASVEIVYPRYLLLTSSALIFPVVAGFFSACMDFYMSLKRKNKIPDKAQSECN